jgi:hypothetical protein
MSAVRYYHLRCDHEGCEMLYSGASDRADATRHLAKQDGWVHGVMPPAPRTGGPAKSLDFCPAHASDIGDLMPKALPMHARPA